MLLLNRNAGGGPFLEIVNFHVPIVNSVKNCIRQGVRPGVYKKLYKQDKWPVGHPLYSPPFPLMLTYGPKHEKFKADAADLDIDRFCYEGYRRAPNEPNNGKNRAQLQK